MRKLFLLPLLLPTLALADIEVTTTRTSPPLPSNNLAKSAKISLIDGEIDANSPGLPALTDGKLPSSPDQPQANFFLATATTSGRILIDLGKPTDIGSILTYSRHPGSRAPQVYTLYGAEDKTSSLDLSPKLYVDPALRGWSEIAKIDTNSKDGKQTGGEYTVTLADPSAGFLGTYRYLLIDLHRTTDGDANANTFLSELVITPPAGPVTPGPRYKITIDTSNLSPEMKTWATDKLEPICKEWYPKIVEMLPSEGYTAPRNFKIRFKLDDSGPPAYALGNQITCNLNWVTKNKDGEGVGSVVHEMVHVVQQYKFGARKTPFFLQEGIPDYIRWYLYEPQKNGAVIKDASKANYDKAYRISANFLNYVTNKYNKNLVRELNAAVRQGTYSPELWKTLTGKTVDELNAEWKAQLPG